MDTYFGSPTSYLDVIEVYYGKRSNIGMYVVINKKTSSAMVYTVNPAELMLVEHANHDLTNEEFVQGCQEIQDYYDFVKSIWVDVNLEGYNVGYDDVTRKYMEIMVQISRLMCKEIRQAEEREIRKATLN
jgi:hypothetical protein